MSKESLKKKLAEHAKANGFKLNPNNKIVDNILDRLIHNKEIKGDYYCPCRIEVAKDYVCPCIGHKKDIKEQGHCKCFLFVK